MKYDVNCKEILGIWPGVARPDRQTETPDVTNRLIREKDEVNRNKKGKQMAQIANM